MPTYEPFDILAVAQKGMNYVTTMVDDAFDYLPYWFIQISDTPAHARHVRVDDAELVASWYEAVTALQKMLGETDRSRAVQAGFKRHLLNSWGKDGLRYHEKFPWTQTMHASFHEQGWVLAAMNRLIQEEPDHAEAREKAAGMVRGMRKLTQERKQLVFWAGDYDVPKKVYEFPGDVYLMNGGYDPEKMTGRGDFPIRNGVVLEPLATLYTLTGDEAALDLAEGLCNQLLMYSKYFGWDGRYLGHVHSTVWVAIGMLKLGRILNQPLYIEKAIQIFEFTRSISSSFGWVPEYAAWHPMSEEYCETCCIKDMIEFALTACDMGYEYWGVADRYMRNQLSEQQIKDGRFIAVDNERPDDPETGYTWRDLDRRVVGGWSGGAETASISLSRFRSIAGCCVGTAPVGLWMVWDKAVEELPDGIRVNFAFTHERNGTTVDVGYPNEGFIRIKPGRDGDVHVRIHDWMGNRLSVRHAGIPVAPIVEDGCLLVRDVRKGDVVEIRHPHALEDRVETVRDAHVTVRWGGPDVCEITPGGAPIRLYQRRTDRPKEYPRTAGAASGVQIAPTQGK